MVILVYFIALIVLIAFSSKNVRDRLWGNTPTHLIGLLELASQSSKENVIPFRIYSWTCSLEIITESPLFGHGTGSENILLMDCYREHNFIVNLKKQYNSHNEYLTTTLRLGIIGLISLFALLTNIFLKAIKQRSVLLFLIALITSLTFLSENFLSRQKGVVFFSFFCSIYYLSPDRSRSEYRRVIL
jgi:O-antigen ligase